jgi:NAD(P)-dependent dehydrogenase (short-subunit alcohol dehydrogenase family)
VEKQLHFVWQKMASMCVSMILKQKATDIEETVNLVKSFGGDSCGYAADVSSNSEMVSLVCSCEEKLGPLNVMVANAGIAQVKSLLALSQQEVGRIFDVNTLGVFNCFQAAANQMISHGSGGKLIAAASIASFREFPMLSHYSATK